MKTFLDSAASYFAAVVTAAICAVPAWYTHVAVQGGLAPVWAYGSVAVLAAVGLILMIAFFRKGMRGIAPSRQRRRS